MRPRLLYLLACPALTLVALLAGPAASASDRVGAIAAYIGGAGSALFSLTQAAPAELPGKATAALLVVSAGLLGAAALVGTNAILAVVLVNLALTAGAHAVGGAIGRRVAHPGHLLPACAVAAAFDFASVVHPSGPSHAIASSERALSLLTVAWPIAGTHAVAPVIGVGDLVFIALVLGVAVRHALDLRLVGGAVALGLCAAGALAALLEREVPALVPIGAAIVLVVPASRRLEPKDRRTASFAVATAVAVVLGSLLSAR